MSPHAPPHAAAGAAEVQALADRLAEEMAARWRQGDRAPAEEFFALHPELESHAETALSLIDEEVFLRREFGEEVAPEAFLARFPRWRSQLEVLFNCHRVLEGGEAAQRFPAVGEDWHGFRLRAELGQGALGRVFLATQPALADRPVVLKLTPRRGQEHLALARLQHTHVVPLFSVLDDPERDLRALCMPYFGGAPLSAILAGLPRRAAGLLSGQNVLDVLNRAQPPAPATLPARGPARQFLARATYVQAVCWAAASLAEALKYAHERGLVHLDIKPSNVLLAADGTPMLLDFHLAHEPIRPGGPTPRYLGGSPRYMSPEQQAALAALRDGRPISVAVDGRSDLYSLALVMAEALAGVAPGRPHETYPERFRQAGVPTALADAVVKCLEPDPGRRYADAGALSADLWRQLNDLPLRGVSNRDLGERFRKWRRRRPHAVKLLVMGAGLLAALAGMAVVIADTAADRVRQAERALPDADARAARGDFAGADETLEQALSSVARIPRTADLADRLTERRTAVRRAALAAELHSKADRLRFLYGADLAPATVAPFVADFDGFWEKRSEVVQRLSGTGDAVRADMLDLAVLASGLRTRVAPGAGQAGARRQALHTLDEAEALFGSGPVLVAERRRHAAALGLADDGHAATSRPPQTVWEHYALGRSLLDSGRLKEADDEFRAALDLEGGLWPNFYSGICAVRRNKPVQALASFHACVTMAPVGACYYHRALAHAALGQDDEARHDYDRALERDPDLAAAALNRGILQLKYGRVDLAEADMVRALRSGMAPAVVHYNLAHVRLARDDRAGALACVEQCLAEDPGRADARALRDRLRGGR